MHICMYVCMYVCKYVCMHVSMYVCMYVCMYLKGTNHKGKSKKEGGSLAFHCIGQHLLSKLNRSTKTTQENYGKVIRKKKEQIKQRLTKSILRLRDKKMA